jgi:hypothetical protein
VVTWRRSKFLQKFASIKRRHSKCNRKGEIDG